jgi:DNA-binding NarL/FixJ family response regulator
MPMSREMTGKMDGLTLLVVAEGFGLAQDLNLAFRRHSSVTVLGPMFDAQAASEPVRSGSIDVLIVDLDRGDGRGLGLVETLRAIAPVPVLASSTSSDPHTAALVLAAGGSGLLPRGTDPRRSLEILRLATTGEIALPDGHLSSVVEHLHLAREARQHTGVAALTLREREVLALLGEGRSTVDIAAALGISASTVQAHIKGVFAKLGVHSQVEAVRAAWRAGLVAVPASA